MCAVPLAPERVGMAATRPSVLAAYGTEPRYSLLALQQHAKESRGRWSRAAAPRSDQQRVKDRRPKARPEASQEGTGSEPLGSLHWDCIQISQRMAGFCTIFRDFRSKFRDFFAMRERARA